MIVADLKLSFSLFLLNRILQIRFSPLINSMKCLSSLSCSPANISTSERRSCLKVIEEGVAEWISSGVKRLREYKGKKINKPEKIIVF